MLDEVKLLYENIIGLNFFQSEYKIYDWIVSIIIVEFLSGKIVVNLFLGKISPGSPLAM